MDKEIAKYKKKMKSNISCSEKRSSHKHIYERVIMPYYIFGYGWAKRCSVCGRYDFYNPDGHTYKDFMKKPYNEGIGFNCRGVMSLEEIHTKYPIYRLFYFEDEELKEYIK